MSEPCCRLFNEHTLSNKEIHGSANAEGRRHWQNPFANSDPCSKEATTESNNYCMVWFVTIHRVYWSQFVMALGSVLDGPRFMDISLFHGPILFPQLMVLIPGAIEIVRSGDHAPRSPRCWVTWSYS